MVGLKLRMLSIGCAICPARCTHLCIVLITSLWFAAQGRRRLYRGAGLIPIYRLLWSAVLQYGDFPEGTVDSYRVGPQSQEVHRGSVPLRVVSRPVRSWQGVRRFT